MNKKNTLRTHQFFKKMAFTLCFSTFVHTHIHAQLNQSAKTKLVLQKKNSKEKSSMNQNDIPLRSVELSTGHQLIVMDKNLKRNVKIVFDFIIPLKDKNEKTYAAGLSDLCETYFSEAYPKGLSRIDFQKSLVMDNVSINIGKSVDRFTITLNCNDDKITESMDKLKPLLLQSDISNKSFELLKQKQKMSLQQLIHDPQTMAKEKFFNHLLGENADYVDAIEPALASLDSISKEDIQNFIQRLISTQTLKVIFIGESLTETHQENIEKFIKQLPKAESVSNIIEPFTYPTKESVAHLDAVSPQAVVLFAHPALSKSHPDFLKFHVLKSILGSMPFESRIWKEVREKRGLAYSVSIRSYRDNIRQFTVGSLGTNPKNIDAVIEIIQKEWDIRDKNKITKEELALHKDFIIGSYLLNFDKSNQAIRSILDYTRQGFTIEDIKSMPSLIQNITLEEINRVAKDHLQKDKLYFFSYGKKDQGESK